MSKPSSPHKAPVPGVESAPNQVVSAALQPPEPDADLRTLGVVVSPEVEEVVAVKMRAGLTREQALAVIAEQARHDAGLEGTAVS